jgi:hypothetical protein
MSEDEPTPEQRVAMSKAAAEANHAAAERTRTETNNINAKIAQAREERHEKDDERRDAENRTRIAGLVQRARTKVHPVGLAITLVVGVAVLLLVLRYA